MDVTSFARICLILLAIDGVVTTGYSEEINAKSGSNATLSCPWTEDSVKWYGIYGHQYSSGKSILSSLPPSLQDRIDIWDNDGYNLRITNVSGYDEGQYKCSSINGTKYITLFLMAPPTSVLFDNVVQPYIKGNEDQPINITCYSVGGHPLPSLQLSKNDNILATTDDGTLVYTMQPSRIDDRSNISCTANHSELKIPLSIESILYLNLKTETVTMETIHILYEFDILNASCLATGGRPPTSFEWNLLVDYYNSSHEDVENISPTDTYNVKSVLSLEVYRSFDKRKLTCRAFDSIDKDGVTRSQTLEVYYAPSINIKYQNLTTEDNIRQLICQPQGNPIIYKFYQWEHHSAHGEKIRSLGIGLNGILNIPELDRTQRYQDTGIYKCFAENGIVGKEGNKTQSGSVFFVNEGRPQLSIYNPSEQFCKIGGVGSLVVKFTSWPPPLNLTWLKYEGKRNFNLQASERYTMTNTAAVIIDSFHDTKIHVDGYIGILHINEVTQEDLTNYSVQIQNEFGIELFTFFLNDIPKVQDYRINNGENKGLFYGGPAVILTVLIISAVVIALFIIWRKRYNDENYKRQNSIAEDVAHVQYCNYKPCSSHKRAKLCDENQKQKTSDEPDEIYDDGYTDPDVEPLPDDIEFCMEDNAGEIYTEDYTYAEEEAEKKDLITLQSLTPPPVPVISRTNILQRIDDTGVPVPLPWSTFKRIRDARDAEKVKSDLISMQSLTSPPAKLSVNVLQNLNDTGVKRLRQPLPINESESDDSDAERAVDVHGENIEISETCSFAAENEGYIPEEESLQTRRSPPPIPTEPEDCNNTVRTRRLPPPVPEDCIENGSSASYASYSGNSNEDNDETDTKEEEN